MLNTLHNLLSTLLITDGIDIHLENTLQLATAVLSIEVIQSDTSSADEQATILTSLKEKLSLSDAEVMQLTERGFLAAKDANDFHQFTSVINRELELPEKIRLIEYMWQVAYVNGQISAHEDHLMHKIVDLLYIPPADNIAAKTRARFPQLR